MFWVQGLGFGGLGVRVLRLESHGFGIEAWGVWDSVFCKGRFFSGLLRVLV